MKPGSHLHFIGIAGHAMRGIALAAVDLGYKVTGSDEAGGPPGTDWLDAKSITWWREPDTKRMEGVDAVIISGGTKPDFVEIAWAQERQVPVLSFAELVGAMAAEKRRIVVAGTHGKTTTSSLITWLLESAGRHPDFLIGIQPRNFDSSSRLTTDSDVIVFEGDEYTASQIDPQPKFNYYKPDNLVVTALEMDHPDVFKNVEEIAEHFTKLVAGVPADGQVSYWVGAERLAALMSEARPDALSYDLDNAHWTASDIAYMPAGLEFTVNYEDNELGRVRVGLYGEHNVLNTLGAVSAVMAEAVPFEEIADGMQSFLGASRRFERVSADGAAVTIIDDYAHHPTEVAATIAAAKRHFPDGKVIALFRPHTYSRTAQLLAEYHEAFALADVTFVTDIEAAREGGQEEQYHVSGEDVVTGAKGDVRYAPDRSKIVDLITTEAKPGDLVLSMTVGSYENIVKELNTRLNG